MTGNAPPLRRAFANTKRSGERSPDRFRASTPRSGANTVGTQSVGTRAFRRGRVGTEIGKLMPISSYLPCGRIELPQWNRLVEDKLRDGKPAGLIARGRRNA